MSTDTVMPVYYVYNPSGISDKIVLGAYVDGLHGRRWVWRFKDVPPWLPKKAQDHCRELLAHLASLRRRDIEPGCAGLHIKFESPLFFNSDWGVSKPDSTWVKDHILPNENE